MTVCLFLSVICGVKTDVLPVKASQTSITKAFRSRFPKIKLDLTVELSKYWDSRIDRAYQISDGQDDGVDVAVLQSLQDFHRWKAEGRLLPYRVASWNDIYPEFIDRDGTYTGLYICELFVLPLLLSPTPIPS